MSTTDQDLMSGELPFVVCRSRGGPYDDEAFRSGWRLGDIAATLARGEASTMAESIRPVECAQADRLAMAFGYTMRIAPGFDPDWVSVIFVRED